METGLSRAFKAYPGLTSVPNPHVTIQSVFLSLRIGQVPRVIPSSGKQDQYGTSDRFK